MRFDARSPGWFLHEREIFGQVRSFRRNFLRRSNNLATTTAFSPRASGRKFSSRSDSTATFRLNRSSRCRKLKLLLTVFHFFAIYWCFHLAKKNKFPTLPLLIVLAIINALGIKRFSSINNAVSPFSLSSRIGHQPTIFQALSYTRSLRTTNPCDK